MAFFESLISTFFAFLFAAFFTLVFAAIRFLESVQEEPIRWLVYALAGIVVLLYVGAPLVILFQVKVEKQPRVMQFDLNEYKWPPEADRLFQEASSALENLGFEVTEGCFLPSAANNVKTACVLLVNREQRDAAMIVAMYATPIATDSLQSLFVEFSSVSSNDHVYDTNNSDQLSAFPTPERKSVHQLPKLKDIRSLHAVHRAVLQREGVTLSGKSFKLDTEYGGDVIEMLQASIHREFADALAVGYLTSASATHYRPTIKCRRR